MPHINETTFQSFCKISQKIQQVQEKVTNEPVTPRARKALNEELETLQDSVETLLESEGRATKQFVQFSQMKTQIISLYREIEEQFEDFEISLISREAIDLGSSLESGTILKVARQVNELRHNIHFLFKHRCPSLQHRKIITLALQLTEHADRVLSTKGETSKEHVQLIHLLKTLLQEAVIRAEFSMNGDDEDLAMELYEIADLFYRQQDREALLKLNLLRSRLSTGQRRRLDAAEGSHEAVICALLEIADGDPCIEWEKSTIHELQA